MAKEDRRIQKSRDAIETAFLELLMKNGIEQITINDIADRANVNRGTVYLHYKDKYDLFAHCIDTKLAGLQKLCDSIMEDQEPDEMKRAFLQIYQYLAADYGFFSTMLNNQGTPYFQEKFKKMIIKEMDKNLTDKKSKMNREFSRQCKSAALTGVVEWWLRAGMPLSAEEMADNTLQLCLIYA